VDYYHATFIACFSGASVRVGYSENINPQKKIRNKGLDLLLTHKLNNAELKHEVEKNLDVIKFMGGSLETNTLENWIDSDDKHFAEEVLQSKRINSKMFFVAFGVGASAPKRKWPLSNFIEVALWLEKNMILESFLLEALAKNHLDMNSGINLKV